MRCPAEEETRREQIRVNLMRAAWSAIEEFGYHARLGDILARAQVGTTTFYSHFPTKDALILALREAANSSDVEGCSPPTSPARGRTDKSVISQTAWINSDPFDRLLVVLRVHDWIVREVPLSRDHAGFVHHKKYADELRSKSRVDAGPPYWMRSLTQFYVASPRRRSLAHVSGHVVICLDDSRRIVRSALKVCDRPVLINPSRRDLVQFIITRSGGAAAVVGVSNARQDRLRR
ncbi:MAG: TetR/AcrR family transcriptional regulator [Acidimicrobiales bacterium]